MQVQEMEYMEVPEGTGKGEPHRGQAGGVDVWVTGGGEAVLQPQHREDVGTGWGGEGAVQIRPDRAVWLEPGWKGRYRAVAGGRRWWGWHMSWRADQGEGVPCRNEWGGELRGGGHEASSVRAQFTRAALTPAPTTQGHRGQGLVYTVGEEMTLKAAEAIKMVLDEGTACMANRTYHVHQHTGDTWQYAFPGDDGMESIEPLPECERQGAEISALARVAEDWVRETGGVEQEMWAVGAIRRARYRRGEWMTREDTKAIFPVATKGPAAAQWRGQAVHIILPDDRVGSRGMVEVEVCHGQGARYQYDVLIPNVVVTTAAAASMEFRIGLGREGQPVQVYTMGHWEGQPAIQWMAEPAWREPLHPEGQVERGKADGADAAELDRAEKEMEKRQKEAAAEGLDMLGDGRDRKDMLQKWAQRLRGKVTAGQNVLIENGEAQPGLEDRIKGCRGEEVRQMVSKAGYHLKARAKAVEDKCRPECTLARCLCRLDGPQEPKGGYHGIRVRQPRRQGPMWLQMGKEEGAPLVYFHQVKHMWVGYADGRSGTVGEEEEAGKRQAKAQILTAKKVEPKQAVLWMQMQQDAQVAACVDSTNRTVEVWGPTRQVLAMALYVGETVRRSRGMAGEWDPDTEMHRMRKVMTMIDYDEAAGRRAKGHTIQVVSPQASATGAADQGVTDLVQDGHTWWVVEPRGDRRQAVVYTAAPLKRVEHPLMRWVGEVKEVRVERTEELREMAVLRALESQMDRCAEAE